MRQKKNEIDNLWETDWVTENVPICFCVVVHLGSVFNPIKYPFYSQYDDCVTGYGQIVWEKKTRKKSSANVLNFSGATLKPNIHR